MGVLPARLHGVGGAGVSLRTGHVVGGYRLLRDFVGGANCRWTFAEADGREVFLKEFQRPKYPPDDLPAELRAARLARCAVFERRHRRLLRTLSCAASGLVAPLAFFREGLAYYHVAPRVRLADMPAADMARRPRHERVALLRSLARAIVALHGYGIVHSDLKPANVLIETGPDGAPRARVIDFDGAFFAGEPPDPDDLEFDQAYMAPEVLAYVQAQSRAADAPGLVADIFSLGLLLHEYWTGFRPAASGSHRYPAEAVQAGDGVRLLGGELDPALDQLIRRMLSPDPAARPTAWEVDAALGAVASPSRVAPSFLAPPPISDRAARPGFAEPPAPALAPPIRPSASAVVIRRSRNLARDEDG